MEEPERVPQTDEAADGVVGSDNVMMDGNQQSESSDTPAVVSPDINEEQSQLRHRHKPEEDGIISEMEVDTEFACSVCLQLSALPTTLTCGHTTCRYCLAQWYFSSKKKECPLCKAAYQGHPKINSQLRNLLKRLYPVEHEAREKEAEEQAVQDVINKYDKELSKEITSFSFKTEITSFCSGILVASCIFVVTYLAWYWKSHDDNLLVKKPVIFWTPDDVGTWLSEISWAEQYVNMAQEKNIDGRILLSVNEDDLTRLINITEISHAKALMLLIDQLQETGVKMPVNLWEYKALYPGRCLFLVFGLKDFPRTTILYLWMYFREDMFYPFAIATQGSEEQIDYYFYSLNSMDAENATSFLPNNSALFGFIYYTLFLPEYLIGIIAYRLFKHHYFTPIFVLATVMCRIVLEFLKIKKFFRNRNRGLLYTMCKEHMKHLVSAFMFMVLYPIIPTLVCDVFFYCALYVSPIQMAEAIYNKLREPEQV